MGLPDYQEGLRDDVLRLDHLPPLSVTASRLLSVSADPDLDIDALSPREALEKLYELKAEAGSTKH